MKNNNFVFPLKLGKEPIRRLLIASFKNDPEYVEMEPQWFDDNISGRGLRILMYRKDKKVDVYWQAGVRPGLQNLSVGDGLGYTAECVMSSSRFEVTANGVDLGIAFSDKLGRQIRLYIREKNQHRRPVPFLAPVGSDVKSPTKLFAVYMKEFDFVVRTGTEISIQIGDRVVTPATFPVPMNSRKVYFIRYASKLVIGEINPMPTKPVVIEHVRPGIINAGDQNLLVDADGSIKECRVEFGNDTIRLNFEPGLPNLLALSQNQKVVGRWQYAVSADVLFSGIYTLQREEDRVNVELDVTENWKPGELPFSYRLVTFSVRSFRTWPTTYKWSGTVDLTNNRMLHEKWFRKR